jgi:hypothetical protein
MDIQGGITRGQEFPRAIESALNACNVALVVIGSTWATCTGKDGRRRLDDPEDWVRLEVAAALRRNVLVVPVLVEGARIPDPASLPEELRLLCQRHACELSDLRWSFDVGELVRDLEKVVRSPKRFPGVKDKRLRWLAGTAIVVALFLGMALFGPIVLQNASHVQNNLLKPPKVTASPVATGTISSPGEKQAGSKEPIITTSDVDQGNRINLLASENGGMLLAASRDDMMWAATINGKSGPPVNVGAWAVFAFKDERPATFDIFTMLISDASEYNVKEFELLQGNASSNFASFQSIGKFQTHYEKFFNRPIQEFQFSPVTAKYLKVKILSIHGAPYGIMPPLQLFGVLQ